MTNAEFRKFDPDFKGDQRYAPTPDCPAVSVVWANAARYCGAEVVFADVDPDTALLTPTTLFLLVTLTIASFQGFDIVKIMTQGGPATGTMIYVYYVYEQAFQYFKLGKASAAIVVFFMLILALTGAQWWLLRRRVHYTA